MELDFIINSESSPAWAAEWKEEAQQWNGRTLGRYWS